MQLKKRLREISKRITPEIESLNIARELEISTKRIEELLDYGEEKAERRRAVESGKEKSRSQQQADKLADHREKEAEAARRAAEDTVQDQEEAAKERGKKSVAGEAGYIATDVLKARLEDESFALEAKDLTHEQAVRLKLCKEDEPWPPVEEDTENGDDSDGGDDK